MNALRAQIIAARAYEAACQELADEGIHTIATVAAAQRVARRAAEIMEECLETVGKKATGDSSFDAWKASRTVTESGALTGATALYADYLRWAVDQGVKPGKLISQTRFGRLLSASGHSLGSMDFHGRKRRRDIKLASRC